MYRRSPIVMIIAGGTGGHVFPALVVAKHLARQSVEVIWLGTLKGLESKVVPAAGFKLETLSVGGLRGKRLRALILAPWWLSFALVRALYLLLKYKPSAVLGMGGFAAGPGSLMAAVLNIPLIIHEQNAVAGITNRILTRLSKRVLLGFPGAVLASHAEYVGNPVRDEIAALPLPEERLGTHQGNIRLLVIGGSQGAVVFNETVAAALALMSPMHRPQVKQQTGRGKCEAARKHAARAGVEIEFFEFHDDMSSLFAWADLVICRAGASSIAELAAVGIASILVPYPFSVDDHQTANAHYLAKANATIVIAQAEFTAAKLAEILNELHSARDRLLQMANNARVLTRADSAARIAEVCCEEMAA